MDFGTAIKNWRDTDHKAGPPRFHKKRSTGTGSFRAASGISQIKYNGKRRIQIPGLGSVKLRHTLPKGLVYEAHIKFLNGQWVASIKMWQPPKPEQKPDNRIAHGAVDTGINPHATDSEGQVWESPKAYYQAELKLRRWQRAQARRTTGCPASTIFAGWRQSVLPVHLLGLAPLLGRIGAVAGDVKLQDDGVVHDPVNRRGGGHGVGKDAFPLREDQV